MICIELRNYCQKKPIEVIDPFVYGQMNGQELVVQIVEKLGK